MISRVATELLLTFSPTITFVLSLVPLAPARSRTIPDTKDPFAPHADAADFRRYLVVYPRGPFAAKAETMLEKNGVHLMMRHDGFGIAAPASLTDATRDQLLLGPEVEFIVPDTVANTHATRARQIHPPFPQDRPDTLYHSPQA
jgi:hypothetical protein